ncbi:uncharacterized protein L199_005251 [Kwoniella botswanensis]|uniref:uncharacterized protein n=1 Tax=Kwoniella botswanensis TaxID=1268659 RepID=UPI00315CE79E
MVAPSTQSQAEKLTTQEKLLLSQAIYKLGAISWPAISKLLTSHPCCVNRPSELFSPEACEGIYMELMAGLEINVPAPDAMKPQAKTHLRLAQTYYLKRMEELQNTITQYETRFKELMGEITSLKSGEADESIRREIRNTIARKYGKKLLDTWFPEVEVVRQAIEDGPTTAQEEENQTEMDKDSINEKEKEKGDKLDEAQDVEMVDEQDEKEEPGTVDGDKPEASVDTPKASQPDAEDQPQPDEDTEQKEEEEHKDAGQEDTEPPTVEDENNTEDIEPKPEKNIRTMKTPRPRRFSPAVSIRSDLSPAPGSDLSPPPSDHPTPAQHGTRSNKRKASVQPKGAPASKRLGRRSTVNPQPSESVEPEPEPEVETLPEVEIEKEEEPSEEEEQEVHNTRGRRNTRRESTRNSSMKKSPISTKATTKDNERSPTTSRRAPSVTSTNRSTPAPAVEERERRSSRRSLAASGTAKSRGMRDDVVSKSVREQSAAVESVKAETEAEEDGEDEEDNKPTRTSARRGRAAQEKEKEKEASTPAEKRGTRASARNARDQSETENTPRYTPSVADISGELETPPNSTRLKPTREQRSSQKLLYSLLDAIAQHRNGNVFQNPVKKSDASDYYQVIKRPMDLKTIRARIKDGLITGIDEFERDVLLIFANAMMYNNPDTPTYEMAKEMLKAAEDQIAHFKNLQHHVSR